MCEAGGIVILGKKAGGVLATILLMCLVFSLCTVETMKKEKPTAPLKSIQGIVTKIDENNMEIQAEDDTPYSFFINNIKIDSSKYLFVVGVGVQIFFDGEIDTKQRTQQVDVAKIIVIHPPLVEETEAVQSANETTEEAVTSSPREVAVEEKLATMTLQEKVAQMFVVRCPLEGATEVVAEQQFGGYILFGRDFNGQTRDSISETISLYQSVSKTPMIIGVDEEGGTVVRISSNKNFRAVPFWSPQALYREGGFELIASDTKEKSVLLKSIGVNVNFAPVCDTSTEDTDFIFKRSFGHSAELTAQYVTTVVAEMKSNGVGCVLKHFPGYGNNMDTHNGIAVDEREYETFLNSDFLPFQAGIAAGAGCVLVSHNIVNSMDPQSPASLSEAVHRILREDLGFNGVVITDDLAMGAIKEYSADASAAVLAVKAGNDLLICTNFAEQLPSVVEAVNSGDIPEERINESVRRILNWKADLGLILTSV